MVTGPDVIAALESAINSHEPQRIAECFTPDYARIPDIRARVVRRAVAGPELWSEWETTGTGPDGEPAALRGPVIMTTRDGRIDWTRC